MLIRIMIIIVILLVVAAALSGLNPGVGQGTEQSTNPIMTGLNKVRAWFKDAPEPLQLLKPDKYETKVYKWQDKSGEWHFSNNPPPAGINSSVETYRSDVNITQAPPEPVPLEEEVQPESSDSTANIPDGPSPLLPITDPGRVEQLIEDAKNVQQLVNDRKKNIDQQLNP
ncbi:MAG: DUF4124 domain-containing protein [Ectothiorhodospiraceae bacterium]|nr:DUF4124 domain-containing protein [Ectothiorhodospiraceae bacterium]